VENSPNNTTVPGGAATDSEARPPESGPELRHDSEARPPESGPELRQSSGAWPKPGVTLAERFRLQKLLGGGANGEVWQAVNIQLGVKVAIKLPNADRMNPQDLERFRREARALCLIHNEHVLRFFEYNTEPTPYLVMELLRGHDLAEHIQKHGPLSLPEAKLVCRQLCAGLQAVHDAGILHRDIKPGNIYCLGEPGRVKIVDFGLMKLVGGAGDTSVESTRNPMKELTVDGTFLGTPQYMSPEQWSDQVIAFQSDLWSIAIVLYKILTGDVPFKGKTYLALARAIRSEQAPEPSKIREGLPLEVDAFFQKALHKDPEQRFASAVEMSQAFEAIKERPPESPAPINGGEETGNGKGNSAAERTGLPEARSVAGGRKKVLVRIVIGVLLMISLLGARAVWEFAPHPCPSGTRDCDGRTGNGCETDITTPLNCGGCGVVCANAHGRTACAGAVCAPACDADYGDCDGVRANGCETDLTSSAGHCGKCGSACAATNGASFCAGGACAVSCNPGFGDCNAELADGCETDLATTSSSAKLCVPKTLARSVAGATDIAVERGPDGGVYITRPSARVVQVVAKQGGPIKTLWKQGAAAEIVVGREDVFWIDISPAKIIKYRKGAPPEPAAEFDCKGLCAPYGLASYGDRAYWTMRPLVATSEPPSLWHNKSQNRMLMDKSLNLASNGLVAGPNGIFWASKDGLEMALWTLDMRSPDKPQRVLTVAREPSAIALDARGDLIFWIERGTRDASFKDGAVMKTSASPPHASRLELATSQHDPRGLAVDHAWVYWSTADGAVRKVRKDGVGGPVLLAVDPSIPTAIDIDERHIYWVSEKTGEIRVVAK
jgi:hypothetical protein